MAFQNLFETAIAKFNDRLKTNAEYQEVLREYEGRSVCLKIEDDATYLISFSTDKATLSVSPPNPAEDMVFQTSKSIMARMIEDKRVDPMDLLMGKIKVKNIGLHEVALVKKLLKA